jgi:hypothetical protein
VSAGRAIREAFVAVAASVTGVAAAIDHEPGPEGLTAQLGSGAVVTMLQQKTTPTVSETGPGADVTRVWSVIIYVLLRDFQTAQNDLEDVLDALLLAALADQSLAGSCDESYLTDDGRHPDFFVDEGVLVKELTLRSIVEELPA